MKIDWTYIVGGIILALICFFLGWFARPERPPQTKVIDRIIKDTVEIEKPIYIQKENPIIPSIDSIARVTTYTDSLEGSTEEGMYNIKHSIRVAKESDPLSTWDVQIKCFENTIREYVTRDSIETVVRTEYLSKPFFLDVWFYTTAIEFVALVIVSVVGML